VIIARGRRYFSNDALINALRPHPPTIDLKLAQVPSAKIYQLDQTSLDALHRASR
jgi:hypothetical protein